MLTRSEIEERLEISKRIDYPQGSQAYDWCRDYIEALQAAQQLAEWLEVYVGCLWDCPSPAVCEEHSQCDIGGARSWLEGR